jgi:hypothetical protein
MSDATPTIKISSPKALSESDWKSIMGSSLHESMMRNRCVVGIHALPDHKKLVKQITDWLFENCNSFYYVECSPQNLKVYIERDADTTLFVMTFNGQDAPVADEVNPFINPKKRSPPPRPLPPLKPSEIDKIMEMIKEKQRWDKEYNGTWEEESLDIRRRTTRLRMETGHPYFVDTTISKLDSIKDLALKRDLTILK